MHFKNERVRIDTIDMSDVFYQITTRTDVDDLADSINATGLLHPPILLKLESAYRIISGFRRISAFHSLGVIEIDTRCIDDCEDPFKITQIAITENALQRPLNIVEKARAFKLLSCCVNTVDEMIRVASPLGIPCDTEVLEKFLKLSDAPDAIHDGLIHGYVSMPVALILLDYDAPTMNCFLEMFKSLQPGLNRQREFLSLITEISHRDDTEPSDLLMQNPIREILDNDTMDRALKTNLLLKQLTRDRFPELSKAEASFAHHVRNLKLGKGMKLIPPRQFEGADYVFQMTFKNRDEINSLMSRLGRILSDPEFEKAIER